METKLSITDLALCIGQEVQKVKTREVVILTPDLLADIVYYNIDIIPILRPLSSMTEEEKKELQHIAGWVDYKSYLRDGLFSFETFEYLRSKGFDFAGWIEQGFAIDKTKMKEE